MDDDNPLYYYLENPNNFKTFLNFIDNLNKFILDNFFSTIKSK